MDIFRNLHPNKGDRDSSEGSQHVDKSLFIETQSAVEYTCKICQAIVIDPYEHIPSPEINCDSIFCLVCAKRWIGLKKVSCPAEGCLTSGFTLDSLRPLGTRETSRLSNLKVKCEFDCGEIVSYGDYFKHRQVCSGNPSNVCQICETTKQEGHDCKTIFNLLRNWNTSLERENDQLKNDIVNLKKGLQRENDQLKAQIVNLKTLERERERETHQLKDEIVSLKTILEDIRDANKEMKKPDNGGLGRGPSLPENAKKNKNPKAKKSNVGSSSSKAHADNYSVPKTQFPKPIEPLKPIQPPKPPPLAKRCDVRDWMLKPVPQYKFHSNCVEPMPGINRVCLNFHYAEKTYNVDQVEPSIRFRTLRSLLTDMMGHDPGQILFMQHCVLKDHYTIENINIPPGLSEITFVPLDTPDYGGPGFQLAMYRLKDYNILPSESTSKSDRFSSPMEELASGLLASQACIQFFSNNVERQPQKTQIKLKLRINGKSYSFKEGKPDLTFGEVRRWVSKIIREDPGRMIYITHRVIQDDMTVSDAGIPLGPTDLTLLSPSFPEKFEPGRSLQLIRFKHPTIMKSFGSMLSQSS